MADATITNDHTSLALCDGDCSTNWSKDNFDQPQDNSGSSATQIFREGTGCCEWVLKSGITGGGSTEYSVTSFNLNNRVYGQWFFSTSDADMDNVEELYARVASSSGLTSNYLSYDAKEQIEALDRYGWFLILIYPSTTANTVANRSLTASSPNLGAITYIGWHAVTDAGSTKLTGFDLALHISKLTAHSGDVLLPLFVTHAETHDLGIAQNFGADFFKFNVDIEIGLAGATAITETDISNKAIFFDNIHQEHNLGIRFVNQTSYNNNFRLSNCSITWNTQEGTSPQIFTNATVCDKFILDTTTFARGGAVVFPAYISDALSWVRNCTFDNCDQIDPNTIIFEDSTINNSRDSTTGAMLLDDSGTSKISGLSFISGGTGYAIYIPSGATGPFTLTGWTYSGYGATSTTNAVIHNNSGNAITINVSGGDVPTYNNVGGGSSTTIVATNNLEFTGLIAGTEVRAYTGTDPATSVAIGGVESSGTSFDFDHSSGGVAGYVIIHHVDYEAITLYLTYANADQSIPVQQRTDRGYNNP